MTAEMLHATRHVRRRWPALPVALVTVLLLMLASLLMATPGQALSPPHTIDYDTDGDGLIEVYRLAQLDAIRYDLDGNGAADSQVNDSAYADAFPLSPGGRIVCNGDCTGYELMADLDFDTNGNGQADAGDPYWNDGAGWQPINGFEATFDGADHTISNLFINRGDTNLVGLLGFADSNAVIRRVGLISVNVSGNSAVGGLVGYNEGTVTDSYATGDVAGGEANLGGLVGYNKGTVTDSYAAVNVSGCDHVSENDGRIECPNGGLVGINRGGTVSGSYAVGSVSGGEQVGGLVGWNLDGGVITTSYATGSVHGTGGGYAGGLVANNYNSAITASYATGGVSGSSGTNTGGLVGASHWGTIAVSYSTSSISADRAAVDSGLMGICAACTVTASYWDIQTSGHIYSRGGGTGKTTAELQAPTDYTGIYANWNIDLDNADGDDDTSTGGDDPWDFGTSSQYPMLRNVGAVESKPTARADYDLDDDGLIEVSSLSQLDAIRYDLDGDGATDSQSDGSAYAAAFLDATPGMGCPMAGCTGYELIADLDFDTNGNGQTDARDAYWNEGAGWMPIAYVYPSNFTATFDGNDHTIANLHIIRTNDYEHSVGLFGHTAGTIRNTGLLDVNVSGFFWIGGLAGSNSGVITASYVTGNVSGYEYEETSPGDSSASGVPGKYGPSDLVGYNAGDINVFYDASPVPPAVVAIGGLAGRNSGVVTGSFAAGSVTGGVHAGGLVGDNHGGVIIASYATGSVTGHEHMGGLVGDNYGGVIVASYATGSVADGFARGGLVGSNTTVYSCHGVYCYDGVIKSSYWDTQTSSQASGVGDEVNAGVLGKTTAELQAPTGYTGIYASWNVDLDNADGDDDPHTGGDDPWDFGTSSQYPMLKNMVHSAATTALADDRAALIALYTATGGPNWVNSDGWNTDRPIGEWHGVVTDDDGRVIIVDLSNNELTGTLPAELGDLSNLAWLDLDYNRLSGSIPSRLGSLDSLLVLRLGSNELTGAIPSELGDLSNLIILGLGNNRLTGSIPSELGSLSGLIRVSTWNNELSGAIPAELGRLGDLTKLNLGNNHLSGEIPSQLGNLSSLETLSLQYNLLTGPIPSSLGNLASLQKLDLGHNRLRGTIPAELGNLDGLRDLRLDDQSYFRGQNITSPAAIERYHGDDQFYLHGSIPPALGDLSNLEVLNLSDNRLSGLIPPALGYLYALDVLDLSDNRLSGLIPGELGSFITVRSSPAVPWHGGNQPGGALHREIAYEVPGLAERRRDESISGQQGSPTVHGMWLKVLNLGGNRLSGQIPQALGNLYTLEKLHLQNNNLSGPIPIFFDPPLLQNLEGNPNLIRPVRPPGRPDEAGIRQDRAALLALYNATRGKDGHWIKSDNWNTDKPFESWYGVTTDEETGRVVKLELPNNRLCGTIPSELGNLTELTQLDLSFNSCSAWFSDTPGLQGNIPAELGNLEDLTVLNLSGNQLTGKIPVEMGKLQKLEHLDLSHNRRRTVGKYFGGLTGVAPSGLAKSPDLTYVDLSHNLFGSYLHTDGSDIITNYYPLEEVLIDFAERPAGSEFYLDVRHNEWDTESDVGGSMTEWFGDLVVGTEDRYDFTEDDLNTLKTLYGDVDELKGNLTITGKFLKTKGVRGKVQFAARTLAKKNAGKYIPVVTSTFGVAQLYYNYAVLGNPLVQDFMESLALGVINGWSSDRITSHFSDEVLTKVGFRCKIYGGSVSKYTISDRSLCERLGGTWTD